VSVHIKMKSEGVTDKGLLMVTCVKSQTQQ